MKATIYFRDGGLIITEVDEDIASIAKRMTAGGFVIACDELWGVKREVAINLSDVKCVVLTEK